MPPEAFRDLLRAVPFHMFDVRMTNDRRYHIDHPEVALIHANGRSAAIMIRDGGFVVIALNNIASFEPFPE